jgi:hypothetical protein
MDHQLNFQASVTLCVAKYVRTRHRCFVAELYFSRPKWVMCIRPTQENIRAIARDASGCKYISLSLEEADEVASANAFKNKADGTN